jgi:hypothetical protein
MWAKSGSSSVNIAIIWINKCLELYILLVNSKKLRTSQKVLKYTKNNVVGSCHIGTCTQRNYDHLKTFRWRNYNHFIIVIQLQIMYKPKRIFIAKLLYVVKALWQPNLDSRMEIRTSQKVLKYTKNNVVGSCMV